MCKLQYEWEEKGSQKLYSISFRSYDLKKGSNSIFFLHSVCDLLAQNYVNFSFILIKSMIFIQFDRKTAIAKIYSCDSNHNFWFHFVLFNIFSFSWLRFDIKSMTIFDNQCLNSGGEVEFFSVEWKELMNTRSMWWWFMDDCKGSRNLNDCNID